MDDDSSVELHSVLTADNSHAEQAGDARSSANEAPRTLTKAVLAELLFEQIGLNKREAQDMVDTFFDEIRNALEGGETVKLSGFGNFQLRDKQQRPGRNPKTGEVVPIPARRVVTFHACQSLKALCTTETNYKSPRSKGTEPPESSRIAIRSTERMTSARILRSNKVEA
jgi:integration host factor subunit alpha